MKTNWIYFPFNARFGLLHALVSYDYVAAGISLIVDTHTWQLLTLDEYASPGIRLNCETAQQQLTVLAKGIINKTYASAISEQLKESTYYQGQETEFSWLGSAEYHFQCGVDEYVCTGEVTETQNLHPDNAGSLSASDASKRAATEVDAGANEMQWAEMDIIGRLNKADEMLEELVATLAQALAVVGETRARHGKIGNEDSAPSQASQGSWPAIPKMVIFNGSVADDTYWMSYPRVNLDEYI